MGWLQAIWTGEKRFVEHISISVYVGRVRLLQKLDGCLNNKHRSEDVTLLSSKVGLLLK